MKRIISILLAGFTIAFSAGCGTDSPVDEGGRITVWNATVWSAPNSVKIMKDLPIAEQDQSEGGLLSETPAELRFDAIRGETEGAQLMFTASENIASFDLAVNDVKTESGATLSAKQFEVLAERYIEVTTPTTSNPTTANMYAGWYPDALVPMDRYKARRDNKVTAGEHQGIWVNLNIPRDAEAGTYTGTAKLTLDDEKVDVPVTVTVRDLTIPEEVHARSAFAIWYDNIPFGETNMSEEMSSNIQEIYYWFITNKRVTGMRIPYYPSDPVSFAEAVVPYAENNMVTGYWLPYRSVKTSNPDVIGGSTFDYDYAVQLLGAMIDKNIQLREAGNESIDLFKKAYYYLDSLIDEPTADTAGKVRDCDLQITKAKQALKDRLKDYPDLYDSFIHIPHIVTTKYDETYIGSDTVGGVQTWCPTVDHFNQSGMKELIEERRNSTERESGEDFWWYTCINPQNPYPSYHIDDNLISSRTMRWMQYDLGVSATLFWNICYYRKYNFDKTTTDRNVWVDPLSWEGCNGDGQLVYPGSYYGLETPISTLRLESIREGNEDYEYLWMTERKIEEINEKHNKNYNTDKILSKFYSRIYKGVISYTDVFVFSSVRGELLDLLENLYNDEVAAMAILDKLNS